VRASYSMAEPAPKQRRSGRVQKINSTRRSETNNIQEAKRQRYLVELEKDSDRYVVNENDESSQSSSDDDLLSKNKKGKKSGEKRKKYRPARTGTKTRFNCTSFEQVLELENFDLFEHVPNYLNAAAQPSIYPPRNFSPESGYVSKYIDPVTKMRFYNPHEQAVFQARKAGQLQG